MSSFKKYFSLTKPGVMFGNVLTVVAGYLLAAQGHINIQLLLATVVGMTLIISSACVINNFFDQDIDALMERTKKRVLVAGDLSGKNALIFGILLGVFGILTLATSTNWLTVSVAILGFITYVFLYGRMSKRQSVHGTLVGAVSGATPILAGYLAGSAVIDAGALLSFAVLFFWQIPEFYSISIYRRDEYQAAGVPVISVVKGVNKTRDQIFFYTLAFVLSTILLGIIGLTGWVYLVVMSTLGFYWIILGAQGFKTKDLNTWSKKMFRFSLTELLVFCLMISICSFLP